MPPSEQRSREAMTYILTDKLIDGYWFGRFETLQLARKEAGSYPEAVHILEYRDAGTRPAGIVPTGRSFPIAEIEGVRNEIHG